MTENLGFFVGIAAITVSIFSSLWILQSVLGLPSYLLGEFPWGDASSGPAVALALLVAAIALALYLLSAVIDVVTKTAVDMAWVRISLRVSTEGKGSFSDLIPNARMLLNYVAGTVLYHLIVLGGCLLVIVPGIIWALKFQFYGYLIVDKRLGPVAALKESGRITDGVKEDLFLLCLLVGLINLLGALCLVIGLLATVPIGFVATALVYRRLAGSKDGCAAGMGSTPVNGKRQRSSSESPLPEPSDFVGWFNRGNSQMDSAQWEDALASFDRALHARSRDSDAWNNRAVVLARLGRHPEALASFLRALDLNPKDPDLWLGRGEVEELLGRVADAARSYHQYLALSPSDDAAQTRTVRERLQRLKQNR